MLNLFSRPAWKRALPEVGLRFWISAFAFAILAQLFFTPPFVQPTVARTLFGVAALLALVASVSIDRRRPLVEAAPTADQAGLTIEKRLGPRLLGFVLIALGLIGSLVITPALTRAGSYSAATLLWVGCFGLTYVGAAGLASELRTPRLPRPTRRLVAECLAVASILVLAGLLRIPGIDVIPPEIHGDEANFGIQARRVLEGDNPNTFAQGDNHFGDALNSIPMRLFGDDLLGLRLGSALSGLASVLLLYLLVRRLFGVRPALLAAFFLAIAQWHIHYSRDGMTCMQALLVTMLVLSLTVRALDSHRLSDFVVLGFVVGVCFDVYYPARVAPIIALLYAVHRVVTERHSWRLAVGGLVAAGLGALIFVAPFMLYNPRSGLPDVARAIDTKSSPPPRPIDLDPTNVQRRASSVFVLVQPNLQHAMDSYKTDRLDVVLARQLQRTVEAFNFSGETSEQYGRAGAPLLDFWTASLLAIGILGVSLRFWRSRFFLVTIWIWMILILGSVLTVDAPFSPRIVGVIPALMIPAALAVDVGWRGFEASWGRRGSIVFGVLGTVLCVLALGANVHDYFLVHIHELQPPDIYTVLARSIQQMNGRYRVFLIGREYLSINYPTVRFLNPHVDGETIGERPIDLPLRDIPVGKGVVFIIDSESPNYQERLQQVLRAYPNGRAQTYSSSTGQRFFASHVVEYEELVTAAQKAQR